MLVYCNTPYIQYKNTQVKKNKKQQHVLTSQEENTQLDLYMCVCVIYFSSGLT